MTRYTAGPAKSVNLRIRFHAPVEDEQLQRPHAEITGPSQPREPRQSRGVDSPPLQRRKEPQQKQFQGERGEVRLDSVPDDGHHRAHEGRQVCAENAEGHARHDRVRHAQTLARSADQVDQPIHDQDPCQHAGEHLPPREAAGEEAGGEHVAPHAVDVGHPHREHVVGPPCPLVGRHGRQIVVDQPGAAFETARLISVAHQLNPSGRRSGIEGAPARACRLIPDPGVPLSSAARCRCAGRSRRGRDVPGDRAGAAVHGTGQAVPAAGRACQCSASSAAPRLLHRARQTRRART